MLKTLIVEDNALFRQTLKEILLSRFPSMPITEAADGGQAFKEIHRSRPDLILMDIRLPGENGMYLTKKIKELYPNVVIIIVTSYDLQEYREMAYQNGADYFLPKVSTRSDEIAVLVESIVTGRGAL